MDPLRNPYFGAVDQGSGSATAGSGNGVGVYSGIPQQFYRPGNEVAGYGGGVDAQGFSDWLKQSGNSLMESYGDGSVYRWLQDSAGKVTGPVDKISTDDSAFWNAALGAAALTGANVLGAGSAAPAATGGGAGAPGIGGIAGSPMSAAAANSVAGTTGIGEAVGGYIGATMPGAAAAAAPAALSSAELAALYGPAGYGAGISGTQTGIFDAILGATGSTGLSAAASGSNLGALLPKVGDMGLSFNPLSVGANLLGGYLQADAAKDASGAQLKAAREANALAKYIFDEQQATNAPLVALRNSTLPQIQALLADPSSITQTPGYQFEFGEGLNALDSSAASRGGLFSGNQMRAAQQFGQNFAGTKTDQALNRLAAVAGLGQVGANQNQAAGTNYLNFAGNNITDMGNARGAGYVGSANAWGNALGNILNSAQEQQLLSAQEQQLLELILRGG